LIYFYLGPVRFDLMPGTFAVISKEGYVPTIGYGVDSG
jgi:hypothetical protein